MKRCPHCNHIYNDDDLNFCLADGTQLIMVANASFEETVLRPTPLIQQTSSPARQGVNPIFAYLTIGLLALMVGGVTFLWIKSASNELPVNKTESGNMASNSTALEAASGGRNELNKEKADLQNERAEIEKQKLKSESEKLDSKKNEPPAVNSVNSSKPSGGNWFVILGSFPKNERWKADERLQNVRNAGYNADIIDTDNYPGFRGGLWSVVIGPYSKSEARSLLPRIKSVRADAYVKSGW